MDAPRAILLSALRHARRRYRLPDLPVDLAAARAAGTETALAFAIEQRRLGADAGDPLLAELFTSSLAGLVTQAAQQGGDPAFQALVLRAGSGDVQAYAPLETTRLADERAVRSMVHAIAHPAKASAGTDAQRADAMHRLRELLAARSWDALEAALAVQAPAGSDRAARAIGRLRRLDALEAAPDVQRYRLLCSLRGPVAGSAHAASQGRLGARSGAAAEQATVEALRVVAGLLGPCAGNGARWRILRSLRTPAGFPGDATKAKDEWDAVLACESGGLADLLLVAEAKSAAAAATNDYSRLHRGLQRLAQADGDAAWSFATSDGDVRVAAASLRELAPRGRELPPHVIYTCTAPVEPRPSLLGAAARAVLIAEPAGVAFAQALPAGGRPPHAALRPVWEALGSAPHLRAALHQAQTARLARAAMLHPDDLVEAVHAALQAGGRMRAP